MLFTQITHKKLTKTKIKQTFQVLQYSTLKSTVIQYNCWHTGARLYLRKFKTWRFLMWGNYCMHLREGDSWFLLAFTFLPHISLGGFCSWMTLLTWPFSAIDSCCLSHLPFRRWSLDPDLLSPRSSPIPEGEQLLCSQGPVLS